MEENFVIKHEYELSIWKDVWAKPTLLDDNGNVKYTLETSDGRPVLDEEKSAVLSTDNMIFPGKAVNIVFKTKINGTHELTFDLPGKYIDPTTNKKVKNYLHDLIDNETKVKLYYKNNWYSFYVKKVTEKREKNYMSYSYSCEDSFISELSKNGYKLTFNEYTNHYIENIHTFSDDIMEGSEWDYDADLTREYCDLLEYQEEKLVEYQVVTGGADTITVHPLIECLEDDMTGYRQYTQDPNISTTLQNGQIVWGFYSEVNAPVEYKSYNESTGLITTKLVKQFVYIPQDEEIIISGNTIVNKNCNYILPQENLEVVEIIEEGSTTKKVKFQEDYRYGLKIVYTPFTTYNKQLERFVKEYKQVGSSLPIYSFTKTRIMVPEIATNYAANGKDMVDTTGWAPEVATDKLTVDKLSTGLFTTDEAGYPALVFDDNGNASPSTYGIVASKLTVSPYSSQMSNMGGSNEVHIVNSGPYSRNLTIDTPTTFAIRLKYKWAEDGPNGHITDSWGTQSNYLTSSRTRNHPTLYICRPVVSDVRDSYYSEIVTEMSALDADGNYCFGTPVKTIRYVENGQYYLIDFGNTELANGPLTNLFIVIGFDYATNQSLDFCVEQLDFFEAFTLDGRHTKSVNGKLKTTGRSDVDYVVPAWANWSEGGYFNWMNQYIKYLNNQGPMPEGCDNQPASYAYDKMQAGLEAWEESLQAVTTEEDYLQYTLVTSDSIVTGKSFDEEIYFKLKTGISDFSEQQVYYIELDNSYKILQLYDNHKYRTLKQEKSNRFNLTQELSKLFQVYPCYKIDYYKNGKVKKKLYDVNNNEITLDNYTEDVEVSISKRVKTLYYSDRKENENKYGFKYGHNLNSISRAIDSTDLVSKMFVLDNLNQYAQDGICTIARAQDNIGKDTYLLNFDYFIDRKIIKKKQVTDDLYSTEVIGNKTWAEYNYPQGSGSTKHKNSEGYKHIIQDVTIYAGFLRTIGEINKRYDALTEEKTRLEKYQLVILEASVQTYTSALKALKEQLAKQKNLAEAYQKEQVNKKQAEYAASCERIESKIYTYGIYLMGAQSLYDTYADLYNRYQCEQSFLLDSKKQIEDNFNSRYESLIKEGVWQDSKYLNDNAYYLDAEKVINDSKGPKITYTINVTDLSVLNKYKFTDFNVGDVTYVEDYEFFDDDLSGTDKFYNERTIVSAITCNLDNPSKNTISLQNYTTKFDDLFSRITASVQSLTFNENIYQRAANFTTSGAIDGSSMQSTLDDNDLTLVGNQDVQIDGNGILVTDLRIPSNKVKIVGSGVFLTADGGNSWYGALENGGINASLLTVGAINTESISIFHENYSNFVWDKYGITAYGQASFSKDGTNSTQANQISHSYVRFNQYGLFFVNNNDNFDNNLQELSNNQILDYVMDNADVAITCKGFAINGCAGKVRFTSEDGIVMNDETGEEVIRLGHITALEDDDIKDFWGLYAKGAYIEGKLYSSKIARRIVDFGSTGKVQVDDISRSMLSGGRLEIGKTVVDTSESSTESRQIKRITTFGAALFTGGNNTSDDGKEMDINMNDYLSHLGSTIYLHKDACFWFVSSYNEEHNANYPKIMYFRKTIGNYTEDSFWIKAATMHAPTTSTNSDRRLKKNINELDDRYLKLFSNLQTKTFNYTTDTTEDKHIGLIAQEVLKAQQEAGIKPKENRLVTVGADSMLEINYTELLTIAIAKIQELEKRIEQIRKESVN